MTVNYKVFTPTTMMVAGPTGLDNTELVFRMLGEGGLFYPHPQRSDTTMLLCNSIQVKHLRRHLAMLIAKKSC